MQIKSATPIGVSAAARGRRSALSIAAALALAAAVSACGSSSTTPSEPAAGSTPVNTKQVAASIEETVAQKRHLVAKVVCPATVLAEKGKTFLCTATLHNPKTPSVVTKNTFTVTIQSNRGYVTYVGGP